MHIIRMLIVGVLVGIVARFLYPGAVPMTLIASAILGIAGSFVAGYAERIISPSSAGGAFHPAGVVYSIIGAMVLIFLARSVFHLV